MSPDWCMERCSENGGFSHPKKKQGGTVSIVPLWEEQITSTGFWVGFKFLIVSHAMLGFSQKNLLMSYVLPIDLLMQMELS